MNSDEPQNDITEEQVQQTHFEVPEEATGIRFDTWIARQFETLSRTYFQQLIKDGRVTLNGKKEKGSYVLEGTETIDVDLPPAEDPWPHPQNLPVEVLYEDDQLIIVNKAKGMIVHPAAGNPDGTLVNALLYHFPDLPGINGVKRPGIVHRLDKDTSGVMVVAKTGEAMKSLANQIQKRVMSRLYVALTIGDPDWKETTIETTIGRHMNFRIKRCVDGIDAKEARTHLRVLMQEKGFSLLRCQLDSGRTHQIRVHCEHINLPIVGDDMYGGIPQRSIEKLGNATSEVKSVFTKFVRPFLHARTLTFQHPESNRWMSFSAPLPDDCLELLSYLFPDLEPEDYLAENVFDERDFVQDVTKP